MTETTDLAIYDHRVKSTAALVRAVRDTVLTKHTLDLQGNRYVRVAGGTAIANAMGLTVREATCEFRPETPALPAHWEAVAEVVEADGTVVGRGSGRVFMDEPRWERAPRFAGAAMAGTRAAARALRYVLGHVYVALDVADTPAEEIEAVDVSREPAPRAVETRQVTQPPKVSGRQHVSITDITEDHGEKAGKPWTRWTITTAELGRVKTFNERFAEVAKAAYSAGDAVLIEVTTGKFGHDLKSIERVIEATPVVAETTSDDPDDMPF